jgi:hypothetical protein
MSSVVKYFYFKYGAVNKPEPDSRPSKAIEYVSIFPNKAFESTKFRHSSIQVVQNTVGEFLSTFHRKGNLN